MENTYNITLREIEQYSQNQIVREMYKLTETLKEEIKDLKYLRKQTETDLLFKHYDICIFEVKQIIKLIKHQYPEIYDIDSERF